MEQHNEKAAAPQHVHMSKSVLAGIIALVVIAAGVIWYLADTSKSAPAPVIATPQPVQAAPQTVAPQGPIPGAAIDLPSMEKQLAAMGDNLKTLDDLKDL